jgi:hypothetical protein
MKIYLFGRPGPEHGAQPVTNRHHAARAGRFLSLVAEGPVELITSCELHAVDYADSMAAALGTQVWQDARLCERGKSTENIDPHRSRVREWFDATIAARRTESRTVAVLAGHETINHVLGCFFGSLENSVTSFIIHLDVMRFHQVRSVHTQDAPGIWKVECVNAGI